MTFPRSTLAEQIALGRAGRLAPPLNFVPTDGTAAMVLGSDVAGIVAKVSVGDCIDLQSIGDFRASGATTYVRFKAHFRPGATPMPVGVNWRLTATLHNGIAGATGAPRTFDLIGPNDREASHLDFAIPVLGSAFYSGSVQQFRLRLELVGTPGTYEVELPGVYIDSVLLETLAVQPTLINRVPDPGDTAVPVSAPIFLEVNDPTASVDAINGNIETLKVYVNGVLAYDKDAGGFQAGFNGPDSAVTLHSAALDNHRTARLNIDPTSNLSSSTEVPIRVVARSRFKIGASPLEFNYSFTTEDLTAPTLASAVATGLTTVRVTTSEQVVAEDATDPEDALNPENWTIFVASTSIDDGLPAVTATVESVARVDDVTFELTVSTPLTRGALYRVEAGPLEDLVGNPMVNPNNRAFFYGYTCPVPDGRSFQLIDAIPDLNVNEDESGDLRKFIACFQEVTDLLLCDIDHWSEILDPDVAPERFVDAMLADLGNPFKFDLSEVDKRRLIRVLVPIYRQKGTDGGLINAIRFFVGVEVTIFVPAFDGVWDLGIGELGVGSWLGSSSLRDRLSFYVVSPIALTDEQVEQITVIVEYMKDARTHFLGVQQPATPSNPSDWELGLSELGTETLLH